MFRFVVFLHAGCIHKIKKPLNAYALRLGGSVLFYRTTMYLSYLSDSGSLKNPNESHAVLGGHGVSIVGLVIVEKSGCPMP